MVPEDGLGCAGPPGQPPFDRIGAPLGVRTVASVEVRTVASVAVAVALAGSLPELAQVVQERSDDKRLELVHGTAPIGLVQRRLTRSTFVVKSCR